VAAGHMLRIRTHIESTPLQLNICYLNYKNINLILYVFHAINICWWLAPYKRAETCRLYCTF